MSVVSSQSHLITGNYQDPFYDSSCSELSDIPEVEEISSPEPTNENSPLKDTLHSLVNGMSGLTNESSDFEEIYQSNLRKVRIGQIFPHLEWFWFLPCVKGMRAAGLGEGDMPALVCVLSHECLVRFSSYMFMVSQL